MSVFDRKIYDLPDDPETADQLVSIWGTRRFDTLEIAQLLECSEAQVYNILARSKGEPKPPLRTYNYKTPHAGSKADQIVEMKSNAPGRISTDVAKLIGCHPSYVRSVWQRYGLAVTT